MNTMEHMVTCLMEECAEVSQRASKLLRFGTEEIQPGQPFTNSERLVLELKDLISVAVMLTSMSVIGDFDPTEDEVLEKYNKIMKYLEISKAQGTLND